MLDDKSRDRILLPPGFGNGYLILSDSAVMHYKWAYDGEYPDVDQQFSLKWDDPRLNINWAIDNPILSKRDSTT
jgi:dTDP-4-dehydrorhamnose 3,5-epimerase